LSDQLPPAAPPPQAPSGDGTNGDSHEPLNIADELKDSYLQYAMSVIIARALPDVRDGLKPSQRRILVAMNDLGLGPTSATSKCAGIIGETMKRYHPHGDASIYPTLVRMAQDWAMRHRLVHGQGNFGSIAGLPPAAHRYTEARLAPLGAEMLADLEYETVDYIDSYDGKYREPLILPSKFPNLLVNGSDGIAVGMATEIPPHNLAEVCESLVRLIDNPDATLEQLMAVRVTEGGDEVWGIQGPDFPTGGIICGRGGIFDGYRTGRGKVALRARAVINEEGSRNQIIVTEVPFQQTRNRLAEAIGELVKDERVKGISAIRDESSARGGEPVRLVIDLKRDADPQLVLNQLYQYSPLQKTASIILLALVDGRPRTLGLRQMLEEFLRHREQVIRRRTEFQLREAKRRTHILEGQLIAISSLDEVIEICRRSPSRAVAKDRLQDLAVAAALMERALGADHFRALQREIGVHDSYRLSEAQAEAVVRLQLGQLAALERDEIVKEYNDLRQKIQSYEHLLSDVHNIRAVIKADLEHLRDKFGDERRTEIIDADARRLDYEDLIPEEQQAITLSHNGYIKRLPLNTYRSQHRGGKGISGGGAREDDFIEHFFVASTHAYLLCFTNRGQMYWLKVHGIPQMSRTSTGRALANVLSLKPEEKITSVIPVRRFDDERYLLMATRRGVVKKTALHEYSRPKQGGIIGISLDEGDTLIGVALTQPGDEIVLSTRQGMAIRFDEAQARAMGRNTRGVRGIALQGDDEVVGMVVADAQGYLLAVCEKGYGKRTPFGANVAGVEPADAEAEAEEPAEEPAAEAGEAAGAEGEGVRERGQMRYRKQKRGGKGLHDIRTGERNGLVVGTLSVRDGDDIMLMTTQGMVNRTHVDEIRVVGRNTLGVRIMNLNEGDRIASIAKVAREETAVAPAAEEAPSPETVEGDGEAG
jgi:DNA gyrase subunit A